MFVRQPLHFNNFCSIYSSEPVCHRLPSHLKCFPSAWIRVLHLLYDRLLVDYGELLSLVDQLLLELVLGLGLQKLLPEGNVGEHRGESSTEFDGRLGAFLKRMMRKVKDLFCQCILLLF